MATITIHFTAQRWAFGIQYIGGRYAGWQSQPDQLTIQGVVETALSQIADHPVDVVCAGRTDSGVHAYEQIIHADVHCARTDDAWVRGTNRYLPEDVKVLWARQVDTQFHARYSAISRCYQYFILQYPVASPIWQGKMLWCPQSLDYEAMHQAAQSLLGEHDFSSFRGADCQSNTPIRSLQQIRVEKVANCIVVTVEANAFLHHMVRNIVGALLQVGQGKRACNWLIDVLHRRSRQQADYQMAGPEGLYLYQVNYPSEFMLPEFEKNLFVLV